MKTFHTPIITKKAGKKAIASCKFKPEGWDRNPIEYEQAGDDANEAIEKARIFLSSKGQNELVQVECFPEDNPADAPINQ